MSKYKQMILLFVIGFSVIWLVSWVLQGDTKSPSLEPQRNAPIMNVR